MADRPNVLFVICDDLNNALAGFGRRPEAPAPNVQRLLQRGVGFTACQSNCPICLPARNALFSGLPAHATGQATLWDAWRTITPIATTSHNGRPYHGQQLLADAVFMPRCFKSHGYSVYGTGKVLHEGVVNRDWWTDYGTPPDYGPFLWDDRVGWQRGRPDRERLYDSDVFRDYVRRYQGVDRFFLDEDRFRHHIEMAYGPLADLARHGELRTGLKQPYRYVNDDDRDPLPDELTTDWAIDALRRHRDGPFFLGVGYMKPHTPLNAPQEYFDRFPLDSLELPPQLAGDLDDCARALIEHRPYGFLTYALIVQDGERGWREWLQAYLACIAFMDDQLGRLLDALEETGHADDTIVVFTSDNGYHMGEKEYLFKDSLWAESCEVPLAIAGPGIASGRCATPVSHLDLYPTLLDLCGLPANPNADTHGHPLPGHSLRELLTAPAGGWSGPPAALSTVRGDTGTHHSVCSSTHRYTLCGNGEEELYDRHADPHEWRNLTGDSEHETARQELRAELLRQLLHRP